MFSTPTGRKFDLVKPLKKPEHCPKVQMQMLWTDIDFLMHINHGVFARMAYDAATVIAFRGELESMKGDIAQKHVREVEMLFKGEGAGGDVVDVSVWEVEGEEPREGNSGVVLGIQMERDKQIIHQCKFKLS